MRSKLVALLLMTCVAPTLGCIRPIGQARRSRLADPMMALSPDPSESYATQKLHSTREGAAGGDGVTAGGGCGCQ